MEVHQVTEVVIDNADVGQTISWSGQWLTINETANK